jgi:hypothetical protein
VLEVSATVTPSTKAAPVKVTVPVEPDPPCTLVGDTDTDESVGGSGALPPQPSAAVMSSPRRAEPRRDIRLVYRRFCEFMDAISAASMRDAHALENPAHLDPPRDMSRTVSDRGGTKKASPAGADGGLLL